jgi:hypothetical protein
MSIYLEKEQLVKIIESAKKIIQIRNEVMNEFGIDLLDTDAISSSCTYEIINQYDPDYNINFSRNGEDAQSNGTLIEQKTTRIGSDITKRGKKRKNAGADAAFHFHAMGNIDYPRYIFVVKDKKSLEIRRIYDISKQENRQIILDHLLAERDSFLQRVAGNPAKMKHDPVFLPEKLFLEKINFTILNIDGCFVYKD